MRQRATSVFREGKGGDESERDEKRHIGGCFQKFVIEPARDSITVEELQDVGQRARYGFVHRPRPESDESEGNQHGGKDKPPELLRSLSLSEPQRQKVGGFPVIRKTTHLLLVVACR